MATQKTNADTKPTGSTVPALKVIAKRDGFRRAGRAWHGETTVPIADLSEKQVEQLKAEPLLIVLDVEVEAPGQA